MHTLFTTVKFVPQSQQMRAKKKKIAENVKGKRGRGAQTPPKCVFGLAFAALRLSFYVFFFFFFSRFFPSQAATVHVLYMNSSRNI